jgi:hypothetical protein
MACNETPSSGTPAGGAEPQYLPYRPLSPKELQQQQQQTGQHPGPVYCSGAPQHHYQPAGANTDMAPAPLRFQRKPVAGAGFGMPAGPPTRQPQQNQASPHPQAGYFSTPAPAPSLYGASVGGHQPPSQQYEPYHPSHVYGSPSPPPPQWYATQTHTAPWQPAPAAVYEMEAPPINSATNTPAEPKHPAQTFVAELQGSEPAEHGRIISPNPSADQAPQAPLVAHENPELVGNPQTSAAAEASSIAESDSDHPSQPEGSHSRTELPQSPLPGVTPPGPASPAADSEGLIVVEKPGPPDHEGLIPADSTATLPPPPASPNPQHHNFLALPPQTSRPGKHSRASTSLGGFANSVFSKDTVKWSKKTASRFGDVIKTAASTAHAAATNAQSAASQAAILHKQRLAAAATNAQSAAEQAVVSQTQKLAAAAQRTTSTGVPANPNGPPTMPVTPQLPTAHTWPGPAASAAPAPSALVGQPNAHLGPVMAPGPGGLVHAPPQGHVLLQPGYMTPAPLL